MCECGCGRPIPPDKKRSARYATGPCRQVAARMRKRAQVDAPYANKIAARLENAGKVYENGNDIHGKGAARRGAGYREFYDSEFPLRIARGLTSTTKVAELVGVDQSTVARWMVAWREDYGNKIAADRWSPSKEAAEAREDFLKFRSRYFVAARGKFKGKPYQTEPFHMNWINAILGIIPEEAGGLGNENEGGQAVILSPPRHGKTELLAHFCIWLMVRNPDIVIIWLAKAERQAKEVGSLIHDQLMHNEKLIQEQLPPGETFQPKGKEGKPWRDEEFEIATRTIPQKAPTFRAIGRGGNLQSVDADLIVTDDIEDYDSTRTPHQREHTLNWILTEVESRKEPHTAWVCIGSRNHAQDMLQHLLDSDAWVQIVETAHDFDCELPVDRPEQHVDCMLWADKFPYSELQKKFAVSGENIVSMRYLNDVTADSQSVFVDDVMRSSDVLDRSRVLGAFDLPPGYELLGSIDPSPGVHQVAQLWGFSTESPTRFLLDMHTGKGGMDAWEDLVRFWLDRYDLRRWVVEDNSAQADYINRRDFARWRQENAVLVTGITTGANKHKVGMGVGSMHQLYVNKQIVLPYGNDETRGKIDKFIREHVAYDPDQKQKQHGNRRDQIMCAWFANLHIDGLQGGRMPARAEDTTDRWLTPAGADWLDSDMTEGWF